MRVRIRSVESDRDYEAWRQVRMAVVPGERAPTVAELRAQAGPRQRYLLAEAGGQVVGSGFVAASSFGDAAAVAARVPPEHRNRGVGGAILSVLARQAEELGFAALRATAEDELSASFARRYGFVEVDRQIEQVRRIGAGAGPEPAPRLPDGVSIVPVSQHPELWAQVYASVAWQAFQDMGTVAPLQVSPETWERDWITDPDAMFVALAGPEVIGCAGLMPDSDHPERAEHALTAVRRDWRRRGVAVALKRAALGWATEHGCTEVYTWTQPRNLAMRALNARLGFVDRAQSISLRADLPLQSAARPAGRPGSPASA